MQLGHQIIASLLTCYNDQHLHLVSRGVNSEPSLPPTNIGETYPWYESVLEDGYSLATVHNEHCTETLIRVINNASLALERVRISIQVRSSQQRLLAEEHFEFILVTDAPSTDTTRKEDPTNPLSSSVISVSNQQQVSTIAAATVLGVLFGIAV